MSLNCLTCQSLQRTDSDRENGDICRKLCCIKVERSWSGNLTPPPPLPYEQMRNGSPKSRKKKNCRRLHSTGAVYEPTGDGPRLVRSCGMRRDWSFEDLIQRSHDQMIMIKNGRLS